MEQRSKRFYDRSGRGARRVLGVAVMLAALLAGCASLGPAGPAAAPGSESSAAPRTPKRVVIAMNSEPTSLLARMNFAQISVPGATNLESLVNGSLTEVDGGGNVLALFAQAVPTQENGLWQVMPDGTMTTTWKLRPGITWHDGTPVTAADFVFAFDVDRNKEIPTRRPLSYEFIDKATAPDAETVTVSWKRVFVQADRLFSTGALSPLPRHLLEAAFDADRAAFLNLPYWGQGYVGSGAFKLSQFNIGTSVVLTAHDGYVFGRPKLDEIEVRFLRDINVLVTNLIAGTAEMTMGRGLAVEQALLLRQQWQEGTINWIQSSWVVIYPQFTNPANPVVLNLPFRQALMYGTDRQALVDAMVGGLSSVANLWIAPSEPEYKDVEDAALRYTYDPRRATQLIEEMGYSKGPDGVYQNSAGERLAVHVRSNGEPITQAAVVPLANMWTNLGVATEPEILAPQRLTDREYLATFPTFRMMRQFTFATSLANVHSTNIPLPENRFVGSNYARYQNPELDAIIDRSVAAIAYPERIKAYRDGAALITRNLNYLGMFYDLQFIGVNNRMTNVTADENKAWLVHQWDVRS